MSEYPVESSPIAPSDGGPAYPTNGPDNGVYGAGMSLRDYFAAKAMQGLCANPGGPFQRSDRCGWAITNCTTDQIAEEAYGLADAMLAARERT